MIPLSFCEFITKEALIARSKHLLYTKTYAPLLSAIEALPDNKTTIHIENTITIEGENFSEEEKKLLYALKPWRKGPFQVFDIFVDTEWQSFMKFNLLAPHLNVENKIVGDIGCNNGYYLFRLLPFNPKRLVGFDPGVMYYLQFRYINHFVKSTIEYELLGVEHLEFYPHEFDILLCLGVLYHRTDPITTLKLLKKSLKKGGELFLDCFMIDGEEEMCLTPGECYSKIRNVHFVPTIPTLKGWLEKVGFVRVEVLSIVPTSLEEQRQTEWIVGESLETFLNPDDPTKTVEGYPAPKRVYIRANL